LINGTHGRCEEYIEEYRQKASIEDINLSIKQFSDSKYLVLSGRRDLSFWLLKMEAETPSEISYFSYNLLMKFKRKGRFRKFIKLAYIIKEVVLVKAAINLLYP